MLIGYAQSLSCLLFLARVEYLSNRNFGRRDGVKEYIYIYEKEITNLYMSVFSNEELENSVLEI